MKRILLTGLLIIAAKTAKASTDVNVTLSSATYSGVICSTQATPAVNPSRIDNYVEGSQSTSTGSFVNRIGVEVQNQDLAGLYSVWIGYNVNVTTPTRASGSGNSPDLGFQLKPGDVKLWGMIATSTTTLNSPALYCVAANGAGANGVQLHIESVFKQ